MKKFRSLLVALATMLGVIVIPVVAAPVANAADPFMCNYNYDFYRYGGGPGQINVEFNLASFCLRPANDPYNTKFVFQSDGNLVQYRSGYARWQSGTSNAGATKLALQNDGNMVIYAGNTPLWQSGTTGSTPSSKRKLSQTSGESQTSIWSINSSDQIVTLLWHS